MTGGAEKKSYILMSYRLRYPSISSFRLVSHFLGRYIYEYKVYHIVTTYAQQT